MNIFRIIISSFFPNRCISCGEIIEDGEYLCDCCFQLLDNIESAKTCKVCGLPKKDCLCKYRVFHFNRCIAPFFNTGTAKDAVYRCKFSRWKEGLLQKRLIIAEKEITLTANRIETSGTGSTIEFRWNGGATFAEILEAIGEIPIPPYLNRESQESDKTTYQTVYSKIKGSVAAPTAGLHFTQDVLAQLDKHGVIRDELTLHVGAGTFRPVKSENIGGHEMHTEYIAVKKSTIEQLIAHDGKAIAVGTTSVRTLESLYYIGTYLKDHPDASEEDMHVSQWTPYQDENNQLTTVQALQYILNYLEQHALDVLKTSTQIIIAPGYRFHIVNMMITNFHQPQSTLLLLVSAFVHGNWKQIYDYALANDFRFLSYGDSSLLIP